MIEGSPKEVVPVEVRRFSDEARDALINAGYIIYALSGQSVRNHYEQGRKFSSTWHRYDQYEAFENKASMISEVAIKPRTPFIPDSNNKTQKQQEDLIIKFSNDLSVEIKGVEAIMGEAPDYVELAFAHLDSTGDRLFGENYDYNCARTKTLTSSSSGVLVGDFRDDYGLDIDTWFPDEGDTDIFAYPLIVPRN